MRDYEQVCSDWRWCVPSTTIFEWSCWYVLFLLYYLRHNLEIYQPVQTRQTGQPYFFLALLVIQFDVQGQLLWIMFYCPRFGEVSSKRKKFNNYYFAGFFRIFKNTSQLLFKRTNFWFQTAQLLIKRGTW